ncbi:hypothetical protein KKF61_08385 [Patescibacteria group bacterium]|nr:hypothetical protein [Patescibacteria group bacterium]
MTKATTDTARKVLLIWKRRAVQPDTTPALLEPGETRPEPIDWLALASARRSGK